ncbi:MAG: hypothetical protein KIG25_00025 [Eubacteriales bacterium]|nr:hypothetical protein [Eubacteriales bacterium]
MAGMSTAQNPTPAYMEVLMCNNCFGNNWWWIIIILLLGNNCNDCDSDCGCCGNNNWWWIIILLLLGNCGEGFGCCCDEGGHGGRGGNPSGCGCGC